MPRGQRFSSPSTHSADTATLSFASFNARLDYLKKEHKKLLTQLKRKRSELSNFTEQISAIAQEMLQESQPLQQQLYAIDQEIHTLFDEILTKRRFGKNSKRDIKEIYQILQLTGRISRNQDSFSKQSSQEDFHEDEEFDFDSEEDFFGGNSSSRHRHSLHNDDVTPNRPSRDVRKVFLRLAERFHPDKVTDEEMRIQYTEIMKEINIAYRSGDFARLLEIDRQSEKGHFKASSSHSNSERACLQLEQEIELLTQQYEDIKAELREVKETPQGKMVKEYRKVQREGENLVNIWLEEIQIELAFLENLRNFVKDFRDKKVTLQQFLQGPPSSIFAEDLEDLMDEMLFMTQL